MISDTPVLPYLPLGGVLVKSGVGYIAIDPKGVRLFGPTVVVNGTPDGNPASAALFIT